MGAPTGHGARTWYVGRVEQERSKRWMLVAAVGLYYALGINPWFMPLQHDDVLYHLGAVALLEEGTYSLNGWRITDWPPVFSVVLAAVYGVMGESVVVGKLVVLGFVLGGAWLMPGMLRGQGSRHPFAVTAVTLCLPMALVMGTRMMSEWPFLALSLLFLGAMQRLERERGVGWAVAAGLLLGVAALTRFIGVFLGAAVVWQWWLVVRAGERRRWVQPEILVGVLGAGMWLGWRLRCSWMIDQGLATVGNYAQGGYFLQRFSHFDVLHFGRAMDELLFSLGRIGARWGLAGGVVDALGLLVLVLVGVGVVQRLRRRGLRPADAYVLVCLVLIFGDLKKPVRYLLPLAPFLVDYACCGIRWLLRRVPRVEVRWVAVCWMLGSVGLGSVLLLRGNSSGIHGGISPLVTSSAEDFYRGEWAEIYRLCGAVRERLAADERVAVHGTTVAKYLLAWGERGYLELPRDEGQAFRLLVREDGVVALEAMRGWREIGRYGRWGLFEPDGG